MVSSLTGSVWGLYSVTHVREYIALNAWSIESPQRLLLVLLSQPPGLSNSWSLYFWNSASRYISSLMGIVSSATPSLECWASDDSYISLSPDILSLGLWLPSLQPSPSATSGVWSSLRVLSAYSYGVSSPGWGTIQLGGLPPYHWWPHREPYRGTEEKCEKFRQVVSCHPAQHPTPTPPKVNGI